MQRIDENTYIDDSLVTCAEYQLFIDELREQGKYYQPDHWTSYQFPKGRAREPILGVRYSDAIAFCEWLTNRGDTDWEYRLPTEKEAQKHLLKRSEHKYWTVPLIRQTIIVQKVLVDKLVDEDLFQLDHVFKGADLRQQQPKPTSSILDGLSNSSPIPIRSVRATYRDDSKFGLINRIFNEQGTQAFLNLQSLYSSLKFSKTFGLDVENTLPVFRHLLSKESISKVFTQRLPFASYGYRIVLEDICDLGFGLVNTAYSVFVSENAEKENKIILDEFTAALNIFQSRSWQGLFNYYSYDEKNAYQFVRWYLRMLILSFLSFLLNKGDSVSLSISSQVNNLMLAMIYLEETIVGKLEPVLGIRLVKCSRVS
jgi:hypothetical protein